MMSHIFSMNIFIGLLSAHVAGDFLFQTRRDVLNKSRISILLRHAALVGVASYAACGLWKTWEIPAVIFVSHALIDGFKAILARRHDKGELSIFFTDQAIHISIIWILAVWVAPRESGWWTAKLGTGYLDFLVYASGLILAVRAGAIVLEMAVKPYLRQLKQAGVEPVQGLLSGGRTIGQLERALIFLFVMAGQPNAIGFLIAAKSILRFGEIKERENRMEAEYIIIGTLMSFLFGLSVAYGAQYLLNHIS